MNLYKTYGKKYYQQNRQRLIEKAKKWSKLNRSKVLAKKRKYRKLHPFVMLSKRANYLAKLVNDSHRISPMDLWKIAKKQSLLCALTGDKLTTKTLSVDHIKPTSKGGKNTITNIRLVTKDVNFAKNNHSDREFFKLCEKVIFNKNKKLIDV